MEDFTEFSVEEASSLVSAFLKYYFNKEINCLNEAIFTESILFDAREHLFKAGLKEKSVDLVNEAKLLNSLINIIRNQPPLNSWNGVLRDNGVPINEPVFQK